MRDVTARMTRLRDIMTRKKWGSLDFNSEAYSRKFYAGTIGGDLPDSYAAVITPEESGAPFAVMFGATETSTEWIEKHKPKEV